MEFGNDGKLNAALTTGIIGTAGWGLNLLGGLLGANGWNNGVGAVPGCGNCVPSEDHHVNRYELGLLQQIEAEKSKNALLEANIYGDQKLLEVYKYIDGKLERIDRRLCQQDVINAQITANIGCMQQTLATLSGLTKTVIPIDSICPEPMRRFNSWVAPTATAETEGAVEPGA